jgi:UrcA family protein
MTSHSPLKSISRAGIPVACALGFFLSSTSVGAQEYDTAVYQSGPREEIVVTAPRYHTQRSAIGAEIRDVSITREVRFNDLDLRSARGARELRSRIRFTAGTLCRKLSMQYPVATEDSPPCFRTAVARAMAQADDAISDARRSASTE